MKKHIATKWLLTALITFSAILLTIYSHALSQTPTAPDSPVSLRYRASLTGSDVGYAGPSTSPTYSDLSQVTLLSTDIINGTVLSNQCNLTPDGSFITIDYQVRIDSVQKGNWWPGSVITVSLPGGKVGFPQPDGTVNYAEIRTPWFKKMSNGSQYYLFLNKTEILVDKYHIMNYDTTGGPQGVFEITNGVVKSNSGRLRDPVWQYHNMALSDFDNLVKNLIKTQSVGPAPTPPPALMP